MAWCTIRTQGQLYLLSLAVTAAAMMAALCSGTGSTGKSSVNRSS